MNLQNAGLPTAQDQKEKIFFSMYDTVVIKKVEGQNYGIVKDKQGLFTERGVNSKLLQSTEKFQLPDRKAFQITHVRIDSNVKLADTNRQATFEKFSRFQINRNDTTYGNFPIEMFSQTSRLPIGKTYQLDGSDTLKDNVQSLDTAPANPTEGMVYFDTTTNKYNVYNGTAWTEFNPVTIENNVPIVRNGFAFPVLDPIVIPSGNLPDIRFNAGGTDLKTDNIDVAGTKFGAGVVEDNDPAVMYIKIELYGWLFRDVKAQ